MRKTTIFLSALPLIAVLGLAGCVQAPANDNTAVIEVVNTEANGNKTDVPLPSGETVEYSVDIPTGNANADTANIPAEASDNTRVDIPAAEDFQSVPNAVDAATEGQAGTASTATQEAQAPIEEPIINPIDTTAALAELKSSPEAVMSSLAATGAIDRFALNTMTCNVTAVTTASEDAHYVDLQLTPKPDSPMAEYTGGESCRVEIAADGRVIAYQLAGDEMKYL